jgi:DNA repair protein RecO (recombination protein O)
MDLLTEARLERRFRSGQRDLKRLFGGFYVVELLNALTDERDPHRLLFRKTLQTLQDLDGSADVADSLLQFEIALLKELGHLPALESCVECGSIIPDEGRVAFGQLAGGVLCGRCKAGQRHVVSLSPAAMALLRKAVDSSTATDLEQTNVSCADPDLARHAGTSPSGARGELRGLMNQLMSHRLGRRSRLHGFLASLR